jgi:hypothetical protein
MTELRIPDAVRAEAWHEFCYPRPATGEPSQAFARAMQVVDEWLAGLGRGTSSGERVSG